MQLEPHVDDVDGRQLQRGPFAGAVGREQGRPHAFGQREEVDFALPRSPEGLNRRCGAAEDERGAGLSRHLLGHGAGVISGSSILLVSSVMLLVKDDQADVRRWGKEGRARPDHDWAVTSRDLLPGGVTLGVGHAGVEDGHPVPEASSEARRHLGRKRNLRRQDQRRPTAAQAPGGCPQVDLGLAAAGDAIEQEWRAVARAQGPLDRGPGGGLCRRQLGDAIGAPLGEETMAAGRPLHFLHDALAHERGQRGAIRSRLRQDLSHGEETITIVPG